MIFHFNSHNMSKSLKSIGKESKESKAVKTLKSFQKEGFYFSGSLLSLPGITFLTSYLPYLPKVALVGKNPSNHFFIPSKPCLLWK